MTLSPYNVSTGIAANCRSGFRWVVLAVLLVLGCSPDGQSGGLDPAPTGSLAIGIDGLPAGVGATVAVTGGHGYQKTLTTGQTLSGLTPGSYAIAAAEVISDGDQFVPAPMSQTVAVTSSGGPVSAAVTYIQKTGRLAVTISGLPDGTDAGVLVTGPGGYSHLLPASGVLKGLTPGTYSVQSPGIIIGGHHYDPPFSQQDVVVAANPGVPAQVLVAYAVSSGVLQIVVAGLPQGGNAAVTVTGPGGFLATVPASVTLNGLVPGTYAISAGNVNVGTPLYVPEVAEQSAAVPAGLAPVVRTVTYAQAVGQLTVIIAGLPGAVPANVTVTGPGGFNQNLTSTQTLPGLNIGTYTVSGFSVSFGGTTYSPLPSGQGVVVGIGAQASATVTYAASTGSLAVTIGGLPGGTAANVTVTGPGGYSRSLTASQTLTGLLPGSYVTSAASVSAGGATYAPSPSTQSSAVVAGASAAASVGYSALTASLTVTVSGLPGGTAANVNVTGPGGFSQHLTASQALTGLLPGTYTTSAVAVSTGGVTYVPAPATQNNTVAGGASASISVAYTPSLGALNVTISGLPGGALASVLVTGPGGFSHPLTASQSLTGLVPGSYTVAASAVVSGGTTYNPAPSSQSAAVSGGATTPASVAYSGSGGGGGTLNLTVDGVYLTQATQRYDGSVPLVAGRNAYLRVFALANEANTAQPPVRVRLYSGATLVQTYSITAPAVGVPMVVDEGSLAASWNVLVPGSLVQPNLRVLADVDPSLATAETNEADNQFPVSGVPATVDVRALPTFNIRFVPVLQQVNGLQGNVSDANKESFLGDLKLMLPVGAYDADVRAAYTTTAPVLQNNNANGAWGTILSEVLALRSTDGNSRYYYGVVKTSYGSGIAGMGYVGGSARSAIGWDYLPSGKGVMAHELGHNMSRLHAPCGGVSGPDPGYPYAGGKIGMWGLDVTTLALKNPATYVDLMGYCSPAWVSDYNWSAMVTYRQGGPNNAPPSGGAGAGLLVWGRITAAGVVLEPSFRVPATGRAPSPGGHRLDLLAPDGSLLRTMTFGADEVADLPGGAEEHFAFVVPLDAALERDLGGVRVRAAGRAVSRLATLTTGDPSPVLTRPNAQQVDVRWDSARFPMVMVRDAATGDIISFARGGAARLWSRGTNFELHFSDGVKSVIRQQQPQ